MIQGDLHGTEWLSLATRYIHRVTLQVNCVLCINVHLCDVLYSGDALAMVVLTNGLCADMQFTKNLASCQHDPPLDSQGTHNRKWLKQKFEQA